MIKMVLLYHLIAFATGYAADMIIGEPDFLPHPATLIRNIISMIESRWNDGKDTVSNRLAGILFVLNVIFTVELVVIGILVFVYLRIPALAISVEAILTYFVLSSKVVKDETQKIYEGLSDINPKWGSGKINKRLAPTRERLGMLTGEDTSDYGYNRIIESVVEFIAKGISDQSIAPVFYCAIAGPVGGYLFKCSDMMDAAVGYKNAEYRTFGWAAARLNDILGFIPSRFSALLLSISSIFLGKSVDRKRGIAAYKRDRKNYPGPNKGQTVAFVFGLIGIDSAGEGSREPELDDIHTAHNLLMMSATIGFTILGLILGGATWLLYFL